MNATKTNPELAKAEANRDQLAAKIKSQVERLGFKVGKTGWHDLGTLRVAIGRETVGIYKFIQRLGTVLEWQVEMGLYGTPFSIIAATINAAVNESAE
jgi:hypothetical protein